jgi:hypothetical protein
MMRGIEPAPSSASSIRREKNTHWEPRKSERRKYWQIMLGGVAVAEDDSDDYKHTLAQAIFGMTAAMPGRNPPESGTDDIHQAKATVAALEPVRETSAASNHEPSGGRTQQKQIMTSAELAEMIELDLAHHPDCPRAGFRVTVYGGSYWRAMLTITPAAGGVRNPPEWRDLTNDLAERLRKHYDLACEY